jgi:hypothetical protein
MQPDSGNVELQQTLWSNLRMGTCCCSACSAVMPVLSLRVLTAEGVEQVLLDAEGRQLRGLQNECSLYVYQQVQ